MVDNVQLAWDSRHRARIHKWDSLSSLIVDPEGPRRARERHIISPLAGGDVSLGIDSLFVRGDGDTLIVALHGALVREQVELPRFEWLASLESRPEHLLFVADSALYNSDILTLGWYIGTEKVDFTVEVADFVNRVRSQLGAKRVVFVGSSGGGYASLAIATYVEDSTVVCFTPQTDVWKFTDGHSRNLLSESFPSFSNIEEVTASDPKRFSLLERYRDNTRLNQFLFIQNSGDASHQTRHFKPFAESLGSRLPNGRTFDQSGRFISFNYGDGHVPPPKDRLHEFIDLALENLLRGKKQPVLSAGKTGTLDGHAYNAGFTKFLRVSPELNSYYLQSDPPIRYSAPNLAWDENGVPMRVINGEVFDHPVLQAQYLLKQLNALRRNPTSALESVARAIVNRWRQTAVYSRGAMFLPYLFAWNAGKQQPPWFSAMAQGQALSAVSRLFEILPDPEFQRVADDLYASFKLLPDADDSEVPWVVDIDREGYLWLEEYPAPGQGKCVINGHLFATWGVYDYWRVFGKQEAFDLAVAALETTKRYVPHSRNPGWSSHYDLNHFFLIRNYHQTHISQMESTYNLTGDPYFLAMADILERDFPSAQSGGTAQLAPGSHVIHRMDNSGVPTMTIENKTVEVDAALAVKFGFRTKVETLQGIWLRIDDGEFAGWWVQESPPQVFPQVSFDRHYYNRHRREVVRAGKVIHNSFDQSGAIANPVPVELESPTEVEVRCRAMWNGTYFYQLSTSEAAAEPFPPGRWIAVEDCL